MHHHGYSASPWLQCNATWGCSWMRSLVALGVISIQPFTDWIIGEWIISEWLITGSLAAAGVMWCVCVCVCVCVGVGYLVGDFILLNVHSECGPMPAGAVFACM